MMNRIELIVSGTPAARPRARHRAMQTKSGKLVSVTYHPKPSRNPTSPDAKAWAKAHAWFEAVQVALWQSGSRPTDPWCGPVRISYDVFFERPQYMLAKSWPDGPILHTAKPDRDNLDKSILDALKSAGLMVDDAHVCAGEQGKWYAARGCGPGVRIVAERIGPEHPGYVAKLHAKESAT